MRRGHRKMARRVLSLNFIDDTTFATSKSFYNEMRKTEFTKDQGANYIKMLIIPNGVYLNV